MIGLGTAEPLAIPGVAFLVFGGRKLPERGAGSGKGIASFKQGRQGSAKTKQLDEKTA